MSDENPEVWAERADAVRSKIRPAVAPLWVRNAATAARDFEDKAVAEVVKLSGSGDLRAIRREVERRSGGRQATFAAFHDLVPDFPVQLAAGRFRFHFDALATHLFNDPADTVVYSAWVDAADRLGVGRLALVFRWSRVARCRGYCVFHNVPRSDPDLKGVGIARKGDKRAGFRLSLPIGGVVFSIEPLPAFLFGVGALRDMEIDDG